MPSLNSTDSEQLFKMSSDSFAHVSDMDSPGSSVSSSLQREYEELLKYAVVTPKIQVIPSVYHEAVSAGTDSSISSSNSLHSRSSVPDQISDPAEASKVAKEDVQRLPSTPAHKMPSHGQGSKARDSLLRSGMFIDWILLYVPAQIT